MGKSPKGVHGFVWFLLGAASVVLVLFFLVVLVGGLAVLSAGAPSGVVEPETVLEIDLKGMLGERPAMGLLAQLTGTAGNSLWDIRQALSRAKEDDRIVAVRLNVGMLETGWASVAEVQSYLDDFRSSGKPVYAYLGSELIGEKEYAVALAADKIWLAPGTGMFINGLRAEAMFLRGMFDKLKIVPEVLAFREYKSAGKSYVRKEMSEYLRESLTSLLTDMQDWLVESVATRRAIDPQTVVAQINRGLLTASQAKSAGWIDAVGYSDELKQELRTVAGIKEYNEIGHDKYLSWERSKKKSGSKVAVVFAEGPIVSSDMDDFLFQGSIISGPRLAAAIDAAAQDEKVKAIVFRINSPGGSAIGSDYIYRAIERARTAKPVVASMSDVAGSGGYWIAVGADKIIAHPATVTGSIGVVMMKLNLRGLLELLGINVDDVTLADNADMLSSFESMSKEQRAMFRSWMEEVYEQFKGKVVSGRALSPDAVENIAKGRVWSGKQALDHQLIDALGGFDAAIEEAKRLANIPASEDVRLEMYPKRKTFFEKLTVGDIFAAVLKMPRHSQLGSRLAADLVPISEILCREWTEPRPLALMPSINVR